MTTTPTYILYCTTKWCRQYHREVQTTMSPAEMRRTTGRTMTCSCGQYMRLVRVEQAATEAHAHP